MAADYYKTLGVSEDAKKDDIKRAYRKLAKRYHPDRHAGDKSAEAKFKEISEAYSTLGDDGKRQEYDMIRKYGAGAGMGGPFGTGPGGFDFSHFRRTGPQSGNASFETFGGFGELDEILRSFFGGGMPGHGGMGRRGADPFAQRRRQGPQRGGNVVTTVTIPFMDSVRGCSRMVTLSGGIEKKLKIKIPAGIEDGGKVRVRGQGHPGILGGRNGDLIITVRVMADQNFNRKGNDIHSTVEISFIDAIKGCKKEVKTLTRTVSLTVPPGTQPGTKMRLKGMGLAVGGETGDQYVEIKVTIPTSLTDKQKQLLDEWEG